MKIDLIFLCIILFVIYHVYMSNKIESMADVSTDITEAIKQVYLADVEAIRNLSNVATQLQAGGLTIPGDLTIKGKLNVISDITTTGNLSVTGFFNMVPKGTIVAFNLEKAPDGWALCDGTNGTPDLRGRFIRMQSDSLGEFNNWGGKIVDGNKVSYDKTISGNSRSDVNSWILNHKFGDKAGTDHQQLSINEMPAHSHNLTANTPGVVWGGDGWTYPNNQKCLKSWDNSASPATDRSCFQPGISSTGDSWGHNNQPPYYVLSYIMKL